MLDDRTLHEVFHIRVSLLGAISMITIMIVALIVLLSILIVYTPIRNILPGYSESLRQQLVQESARVDSLQADLTTQRRYLDVIKQLTAGDIETDSVQSLDSLQRVERAQLVAQSSEATEAFKAQYEQKIEQSARPDLHEYSISVRTTKGENVMATTRGTLVSVERLADNTYLIALQNGSFTTIYRHVSRVLKSQGTMVERGESLGIMDGEKNVSIELWDGGQFVNPEEVIVW